MSTIVDIGAIKVHSEDSNRIRAKSVEGGTELQVSRGKAEKIGTAVADKSMLEKYAE